MLLVICRGSRWGGRQANGSTPSPQPNQRPEGSGNRFGLLPDQVRGDAKISGLHNGAQTDMAESVTHGILSRSFTCGGYNLRWTSVVTVIAFRECHGVTGKPSLPVPAMPGFLFLTCGLESSIPQRIAKPTANNIMLEILRSPIPPWKTRESQAWIKSNPNLLMTPMWVSNFADVGMRKVYTMMAV